ncbi:MAG: n-acetylglutamate synthase [Acidimicrobiia bacterium]
MDYNLDGKTFRPVSKAPNGEVGTETRFHYRQQGRLVTATYSGGDIVAGHLIANVLANGQLDMRYHHVNTRGELMLGKCLSTPKAMPDGRLRFLEEWQWLSGDQSSGTSEIEEA